MNAAFTSFMYVDPKLLEPKALAAWRALEARYAGQIRAEELDHLYALYILGLTTPFFGHREPERHLEACRALLALALTTPERVSEALSKVPPPSADWVRKAFASIEHLGAREGETLLERLRNPIPSSSDAGDPTMGPSDKTKDGKHA